MRYAVQSSQQHGEVGIIIIPVFSNEEAKKLSSLPRGHQEKCTKQSGGA